MSRPRSFVADISSIAMIILLSVTFSTNTALAHHCKGKHSNDPGCDGGTEPPADPAVNPALAFTTLSDDSIKLIDIDGSNLNQIFSKKVERGQWIWTLRWSPDGNQIAYQERYDAPIVVVDADGDNPVSFLPINNGSDLGLSKYFEWRTVNSAVNGSSTRIFFLAVRSESNSGSSQYYDIYTIDPGISPVQNAHRITDTGNVARLDRFTVSPDGTQIVATYHEDDPLVEPDLLLYQLSVGLDGEMMITSTSTITPSTTPSESFNPGNMKWANLSNMIVYVNDNDLFALDIANGSTVTQLEGHGANLDIGCIRSPVLSPDDSKLAFDIQCDTKSYEGLRVADIGIDSGTGQLSLTNIIQITTGIDGGAVIDWRPSWTAAP